MLSMLTRRRVGRLGSGVDWPSVVAVVVSSILVLLVLVLVNAALANFF